MDVALGPPNAVRGVEREGIADCFWGGKGNVGPTPTS